MPVAITTKGLEGEGVHSSQASATDRGGPGARAIDGTINGVLAEDAPSQPSVTEPTGSMGGETCERALSGSPPRACGPPRIACPRGPGIRDLTMRGEFTILDGISRGEGCGMSANRWERWAPLSGVVYVVLSVAGFTIGVSGSPDTGAPDREFLSYYADSGNRTKEIVAFFLFVVAGLFLLCFVGSLRDRLRSVESEPRGLSALAFGAGVASAALFAVAVALGSAMSFAIEDSDQFVVDPNLARLFGNTSYLLIVASTMVASLLVAPTSMLVLRTAVLPRWLGWVGIVVAIALLVAVLFIPIFLLWAWVLVVGVILTVRPANGHPHESPRMAT